MSIKISNQLLKEIIFNPIGYSRETGGFVGINDDVIVQYMFDEGMTSSDFFTYRPDVTKFNKFIAMCNKKGIKEYGILHTHLNENGVLSNNDIVYITSILEINAQILEMYFPVVIPGNAMRIYKAKRNMNNIEMEECVMEKQSEKKIVLPEGEFCGHNCADDCIYWNPYKKDNNGRQYCNHYDSYYYPTERQGCLSYKR